MPERHVIEFRLGGRWTMQHPVSCRQRLFDCPFNDAAMDLKAAPEELGRFVAELADGVLVIGRPATREDLSLLEPAIVRDRPGCVWWQHACGELEAFRLDMPPEDGHCAFCGSSSPHRADWRAVWVGDDAAAVAR